MARTLTLTAAEWGAVQAGGWLVRPGMPCPSPRSCPPMTRQMCRYGGVHRPADLVAAAMPCETCEGKRCSRPDYWSDDYLSCPDCCITLLGRCPECNGTGGAVAACSGAYLQRGRLHYPSAGGMALTDVDCPTCEGNGTVILGYAYPVGDVLPIVAHDVDFLGPCIVAWHREPMPSYVLFADPVEGVAVELPVPRLAGLGQSALRLEVVA